jgi:tetratricopeptide (TPR) repeat protein
MPETGPEIPRVHEIVGEEVEHAGRYGKAIAVAVVVTTLIGALVAWGQVSALRAHDRADAQAERYGSLSLTAAAVGRGQAQTQVDRFNLLTQEVRQADNASLFQRFGTSSTATDLLAKRWNQVAAQTEADTPAIARSQGVPYICSRTFQKSCPAGNATYSPDEDPNFPTRLQEAMQWSSYRLSALRDGANQRAEDWESKFVHYAAALTALAVAVFLFGYSLTPNGQPRRRLYSGTATGLVLVAGIYALVQALTPISQPPDAAATAYADAEVAKNTGDYETAIADYTSAVKLRPRFVGAYAHRAQAEYEAGIPHIGSGQNAQQTTAGPVTLPPVEALDSAVEDELHAREEGSGAADLLANLNSDLLYRGLLKRNPEDLRSSYGYGKEALDKLRTQAHVADLLVNVEFNQAELSLVLGQPQVTQEYAVAEHELHASDVNTEFAAASALTDLNLIGQQFPALKTKADALQAQIVHSGETYYDDKGKPYWDSPDNTYVNPVPSKVIHFGQVKAEPDPGHAYYQIIDAGNFDLNKDLLSVQWEYRDPIHGEWTVLPEVSGPVLNGQLIKYSDGSLSSNNPSYLSGSSPATCLPPGQYRVRLYANGRLAGAATATGRWPALKAVRFREVEGAACVPPSWKALPSSRAGTDAYIAPDLSGGAFIFSIPKQAALSYIGSTGALYTLLESAVHGLSGQLTGVQSQTKHFTPFFMSASNGQQEFWTYDHGFVYSGIGTALNGQVYVGVTWSRDNDRTADLFHALSPL